MTDLCKRLIVLAAGALALGGCSLIIDDKTKCVTNDDCAGTALCVQGVCTDFSRSDAGAPIAGPDAGAPDAGPQGLVIKVSMTDAPVAGVATEVTVSVEDADGQPLTGYEGTIRFSTTDTNSTLPQAYAFTEADQGVHTFNNLILRTAKAHTVTATDVATLTAGSANVTVQGGAPATLTLTGMPLVVVAGTRNDVTVKAFDAFGNLVTSYAGTVAITSDDPKAQLPPSYAFTAADKGVHVFTGVELRGVGTRQVTATDTAKATVTGKQANIIVNPADAATLVLSGLPTAVDAGAQTNVTVTAADAFGNTAPGYKGKVHFTSNDAAATLPADYQFLTLDKGVKAFTNAVVFRTLGKASITATDTVTASITGTKGDVDVRVGGPAKLSFTQAPIAAQVGSVLSPVKVAVLDTVGNPVATATNTITLSKGKGPTGNVTGTLAVAAVAGVATFSDLKFDAPGSGYSLLAAATGLAGAESGLIDVSPCPAGYTGPVCTDCLASYHHPAGQPTTCVDFCTSPMPCTSAPAKKCVGNVSYSYAATGTCAPSASSPYYTCSYAETQTDCALTSQFCDADTGSCVASPCVTNPCPSLGPVCSADLVTLSTRSNACAPVDAHTRTCTPQVSGTTDCTVTSKACKTDQCVAVAAPGANDLLITEVMADPTGGLDADRWFEIKNLSATELNLADLIVEEASGTPKVFALPHEPQLVPAGGTYVLGGGTQAFVDATWPGAFTIAAAAGNLSIKSGTTVLESLVWDATFPHTTGAAMNLSSQLFQKGSGARAWSWCDATATLAGGSDKGSPGAANDACGIPATPALSWCSAFSLDGGTAALLPTTALGRAQGAGVTDRNLAGNDLFPFLVGEMGRGPATDADATGAGWTWIAASFDPAWAPSGSPDNARDQMKATLTFPAAGSYHWAFRFAFKDPVTGVPGAWTYCGAAGVEATPTAGTWASFAVPHTAQSTSLQINAVRAAADGTGLSLPVEGALVTYTKTAPGSFSGLDGAGFFVQTEQGGPALYVAVDPGPLNFAVGDKVSFTVTAKATTNGLVAATAITGPAETTAGNAVAGLSVDVSSAANLTSPAIYESRLVRFTGAVDGAWAESGAGAFVAAPLTTAGLPSGDANLRFRLPFSVADEKDLVKTCSVTVAGNGTPLWRDGAVSQPSVWGAADFTVSGCPAPKVVGASMLGDSATAAGKQTFVVAFDRRIDGATLLANGTQFGLDNGGVANGATASTTPREIIVTTTADLASGTTYTVTPAATLKDALVASVSGTASLAGPGSACNHSPVVISQVYGGGGNVGAAYNQDFIELHNRSNTEYSLTGHSLQYASATHTSGAWSLYAFPTGAAIPAGAYLLVAITAAGPNGSSLPTVDATATGFNLSATDGKVLFAKTNVAYTTQCPSDSLVLDLVGYGAANCQLGTATAPATSSASAVRRVGAGCVDTTQNGADFALVAPTPRNGFTVLGCSCLQ